MFPNGNQRGGPGCQPHSSNVGAEQQPEGGYTSRPCPHFTIASGAYAHRVYQDAVKDQDVHVFLENSSEYDSIQKTWFPGGVATREQLLNSTLKVLTSVLRRFGESNRPGIERKVVHVASLRKGENEPASHLAIQACGPSFQAHGPIAAPTTPGVPDPASSIDGVAAYILIKLDTELGSESDNVKEMEDYAKAIFRSQPNRFYARSLILSENRARLVHFDRAGAQITPPIDIHKHPDTLIRLVSGLSSADERLLGIDDSIQWTIIEGKKAKGTLTTRCPNGESKTYSILEQIPIPCDPIRGRGTTCWRVQDPETAEEYVVKDTWRPEEWSSEHELLELVKGIPGVVQMVSHETGHMETRSFRCPSTSGRYHNRIATRITTKAYGKPVDHFRSVLQLLYAIRDAIEGHHCLVNDDLKIIHRDVSLNNVLLGNEGAPEGYRGILIDLELAFKATPETPTMKAHHDIGTRTFQSLSVLASYTVNDKNNLPHGYLDDLESFFYVLVYIFLLFRPDGSPQPPQDPTRQIPHSWGCEQPDAAASNKYCLYDCGSVASLASSCVESTWGPACFKLFEDFRDWVSDMTDERRRLWRERHPFDEDPSDPLEDFLSRREEHYSEVLKMFDDTINAIEASPTKAPTPPVNTERLDDALHLHSHIVVDHSETPSSVPPVEHPSEVQTRGTGAPLSGSPTSQGVVDSVSRPLPVAPVVSSPASTTAAPPLDIKVGPPPICTTPIVPPISSAPPVTPQPRRSSRIRDLRLTKGGNQPLPRTSKAFPPAEAPPPLTAPIRRSNRIRKRRLEDDETPEMRPPKTKRVKKAIRATARSR